MQKVHLIFFLLLLFFFSCCRYEDGDGNKVSTDVEVEVTDSTVDETASYNLPLISTFNRKDHNKELFCKIQHENADDVTAISLGPLDVKCKFL